MCRSRVPGNESSKAQRIQTVTRCGRYRRSPARPCPLPHPGRFARRQPRAAAVPGRIAGSGRCQPQRRTSQRPVEAHRVQRVGRPRTPAPAWRRCSPPRGCPGAAPSSARSTCRRAELCGLRWSDIDTNGAGLRVRQTIVSITRTQATPEQARCPVCGEIHVGRLIKAPKSRKGRRWVPLVAPAREALARHRAAQQEEREFFGIDYQDHGLVFCRPDGIRSARIG